MSPLGSTQIYVRADNIPVSIGCKAKKHIETEYLISQLQEKIKVGKYPKAPTCNPPPIAVKRQAKRRQNRLSCAHG